MRKTEREIHGAILKAMTPEDCHAALQALWQGGQPSTSGPGPDRLGRRRGRACSSRGGRHANQTDKHPPCRRGWHVRLLTPPPKSTHPWPVFTRTEDLDFAQVQFDNGVRLNLKATDFKERQVLIACEPVWASVAWI